MKTDQEVKPEEVDTSMVQINPVEKVKLDLDIPAINAMRSRNYPSPRKVGVLTPLSQDTQRALCADFSRSSV